LTSQKLDSIGMYTTRVRNSSSH